MSPEHASEILKTADQRAEEIAGYFVGIQPIRQETESKAHLLMNHQAEGLAIIEKASALRVLFKHLSYGDYCLLESDLQRAGNHSNFILDVADASTDLREIYDLLGELQPKVPKGRFLNDLLLLLLRISFPLGKNVVNAQMQEDERHPLSLDAGKQCTVKHGAMTANLIPEGEDTRINVFSESSSRPQSCLLSEGRTIILGRKLEMGSCFGVDLGGEISMPVSLPVSDRSVSRGAVLIGRHAGRIFIFDRGARNGITAEQQDMKVEYDPKALNPNGTFGHSILSYKADSPLDNVQPKHDSKA